MPFVLPLVLSGLLLCPEGAVPTATAAPLTDDAPIATIDGKPLTKGDYKEYIFSFFGTDLLDSFIAQRLAERLAAKEGVSVTDKEAAEWIEDKVALMRASGEYGSDYDGFRKKYGRIAKDACLLEKMVKRQRITEEGIHREYDMRYGEKRRVRHILVATGDLDSDAVATEKEVEEAKKKTDDLVAELKQGADFAKLAKERSDDKGSGMQGGELGEVGRSTPFVPEFLDAAFKLKESEVSEPVRSRYGFHIIQVTKVVPPAKPLDEKLAAELKKEVMDRPVDRQESDRFLKDLRKNAKVEKKLE